MISMETKNLASNNTRIDIPRFGFENFCSFNGYHEFKINKKGTIHQIIGENLDFDFDVGEESNATEVDLIAANNGSGKSTFVKIIGWVLFGLVPNNEKINADNLINKKAKKDLSGFVELNEIFDLNSKATDGSSQIKNSYRIERYRKHKKHKNLVKLFKFDYTKNEWEDITYAEKKITQEEIEKILLMNFDTFMKTVLVARDGAKNFLELNSYEKGKHVENLIRSDKFNQYIIRTKDKLRDIKKELDVTLNDISKLESSIGSLKTATLREIAQKKKQRDEKNIEIEELNRELNELNHFNITAEDELEIERYIQYLKEFSIKSKQFQTEKAKKDQMVDSAKKAVKEYTKEKRRFKNESSRLRTAQMNGGGIVCESCGDIANKSEYKKYLQEIFNEVETSKKDLSNIRKNILKNSKVRKEFCKEFTINKTNLKTFLSQEFALSDVLKEDIKQEINTGSNSFSVLEKINKVKSKIENIQEQLKIIKSLSNVKANRIDINGKRIELQLKKDAFGDVNKRYNMNLWWDERLDFRNENSIKQYIFVKVIPVLNNTIQRYLNILYDNKMSVTLDSSFNESIIYNEKPFSYYELSTGERVKLNLVFNLAIFELTKINLKRINVIFFDEIFQSLDEFTIKKFLEIVRKFYLKDSVVYVISHSHGVDRHLNPSSVIKIQKKNEDSNIVLLNNVQ